MRLFVVISSIVLVLWCASPTTAQRPDGSGFPGPTTLTGTYFVLAFDGRDLSLEGSAMLTFEDIEAEGELAKVRGKMELLRVGQDTTTTTYEVGGDYEVESRTLFLKTVSSYRYEFFGLLSLPEITVPESGTVQRRSVFSGRVHRKRSPDFPRTGLMQLSSWEPPRSESR